MKLRVENLAKIEKAEVDVKNLTLFVGQNSTHKSYMAHVIYELYKEIANLGNNHMNWSRRNKLVSTIIKNIEQNDFTYFESLEIEISGEIDEEQVDTDEWVKHEWTIVTLITPKYNNDFKERIKRIYTLLLKELTKTINLSFNIKDKLLRKIFIDNIENDIINKDKISVYFDIPKEHFEEDKSNITTKILNKLIQRHIDIMYEKLQNYEQAYYFPASRTGFVLTLDEIYAGIFRDKFRGQVSATRLGEPTIDFIQTFADIKTGKDDEFNLFSPFYNKDNENKIYQNKLIKYLEKEIIKGQIKEVKNDQDYTTYYLNINGTNLDLHLASSATLETLPFIVFIKNTNNIKNTLFVIEEPEAHLHPKAQVQMAKFIVLLANTGAKVLVTTHSDYILNEINNCIKLSSVENENEFAISKDNVSAYLFKNEETKTTVTELEIDKFGISNDNFDEVLDELLDRSDELNERILKND